jgi:pyruvate-formate lyase
MFESAKRNEGMVDQKIFKTAKKYGFDSVYFDECSMEILEKYITYIRPLLTPTCEYVLVNRNGKQFQFIKHSGGLLNRLSRLKPTGPGF